MGDNLTEEEILRLLEESGSEIDDDGFQTENSSSEIDGNYNGSLWANWSAVKLHEMYQFFGIIIHMCLVHKPNITDYWSNDLMLDSSLPAKIMKRDRLRSIYFMLHVNNNDNYVRRGQPNHDPIHKIRPFFDNFVLKSKNSFSPGENLTVDEGLCPFRGRIRFRVYIKNKPSRYGIKFFILSDSATGYVLNCEVYTGAGEKDNSADSVVLRLCNSYLSKGHTLYMDRFYTSVKLFEKLFDEGTSAVGTVMRNRRGIPQEFKQNKLRRGEIVFKRKNSVLALHWKDTRDVFALSTKHRMTSSVTKTKSKAGMVEKLKPDLILDYNKNKTGVDHGDQLVTYYYFQRRTMKWWKKEEQPSTAPRLQHPPAPASQSPQQRQQLADEDRQQDHTSLTGHQVHFPALFQEKAPFPQRQLM
ncbi:piggyBac transposable element-derived protein 4-like [Schistocerca piceifrons]|uniref:piggyBac transposable element-derived protein 4-like n=1 Tax=Schistocerca piceifrons TaxID=274613 RepID=UPI001F5E8E28|nr:piggyBac transposable element-derived protein 4-like [Schistocerca piceifrons]